MPASEPPIGSGLGLVTGGHGDSLRPAKPPRWHERDCGRVIQSARGIGPHTSDADRSHAAVTSVTSCNQQVGCAENQRKGLI